MLTGLNRRGMTDKIQRWVAAHPRWTLTFATVAALAPFLAKPFNIDDPLFLWAARQIRAHPLDPYGFNVEWGWTAFPMWKVTENPPLVSYFIALASMFVGWGEIGLHLAFLLPAIALILGTHRLAIRFCARPALVALLTLFAPVAMVSSLTLMCDITMLAFWIWAVIFWTEGIEQGKISQLALAGILVSCAEMTKYFGACLLPLLAVQGLASRRHFKRWAPFLLIPVAVLTLYQHETAALYGVGLLDRAADYAGFSRQLFGFSKFQNALVALSFLGGSLASAVFLLPLLWRRRDWPVPVAAMVLMAAIILPDGALWQKYGALQGAQLASVKIQMIFWAASGICLLELAVTDLCFHRNERSVLLFLWVVGTFVFASLCNWTVNARSILPLCPAVAILVARRLEARFPGLENPWPARIIGGLLAAYALAWGATMADFSQASACRQAAQEICDDFGHNSGTVWFQGHWGFQLYMTEFGGTPLDFKQSLVKPHDLLVVPSNNTNLLPPDARKATLLKTYIFTGAQYLSTLNAKTGAGFYASVFAPLPFAFGLVPPEIFQVYALEFPAGILTLKPN